jgi:hypothetical protein
VTDFLYGAITMGFVLAGLFFAKFGQRSRDPLFAIFAVAFWLLALNQGLLIVVPREEHSLIYLLRLAAFALIAAAIVQKNAASRRAGPR